MRETCSRGEFKQPFGKEWQQCHIQGLSEIFRHEWQIQIQIQEI